MKLTPLHSLHSQRAAKMTEFQGWMLPAQFGDPADEHHAVRAAAGLFDVSFLGKIELAGRGAEASLQQFFTRNLATLTEGAAKYGLLCNKSGFILDNVLAFKLPPTQPGKRFLITTNAISTDKVLELFRKHAGKDTHVAGLSGALAQFALQGPRADAVLEAVAGTHFKKIKQKQARTLTLAGASVIVSRTGLTGERGYELFLSADQAAALWNAFLDAGKGFGLLPCGMTCRDMLRLEAGYVMYGNDIDETRSPVEAGLMSIVDLNVDFLGRDAIVKRKTEGAKETIVGYELLDKGLPKPGATIFSESREIGIATSSAHSPHRRRDIGLGYVSVRYAQPGQEIEIEVKDQEIAAKIVSLPFYKRK
ncbi:MAG: glycine cleavage system aminomethyltransferase GcvT [Nitrospirae bacterium]|nr:glycine cleavage system aminomethyltransferase GcvT [Nitrospirota bacterium]NTW65919.1 glycine cleavage system aminomethyltransferase GcvT [Nitrospirota bacterium]